MHRFTVPMLCGLLLVTATSLAQERTTRYRPDRPAADMLKGEWKLDVKATTTANPQQQPPLIQALEQSQASLLMEFKESGNLATTIAAADRTQNEQASWQVLKESQLEASATLRTQREGEASEDVQIRFLSFDQLQLILPGKRVLVFERVVRDTRA